MIREGTSEQRTSDTRNTPHSPDQTKGRRSLPQRKCVRQHDNGPGEQTRSAHASHGSTHDKGRRTRGDGAYETANLKHKDGDEVNNLDGEIVVELAVQRLECGRGEQVR